MKTLALLVLAGLCRGADEEPVAIMNVRILTVTKGEIESGTIVIKGEKIAAIGADVKAPAGARIVDGKGLTAFPGLVHAHSRLGLGDAPSPPGVTPQNLAFDEINSANDAYGVAARSGVTSVLLLPAGGGIAGQCALVKPPGWTREELVIEKSAALRIVFTPGSASKDGLRQALDGAKRSLEAEKKTPGTKLDEKVAPLVRFLKGELPALVEIPSPGELLHFWQVMDAYAEFKTQIVYVTTPEAYKASAELGARKARVLLRPFIALAPFTRERINTAAELTRAGAEVGFAPPGDSPDDLEGHLFRVAELVKFGLPRDAALRALTIVPAAMMGQDKRIGSLEAGKDADVLLFSGDPLSPQSRIRDIYIQGKPVHHGD